MKPNQETESDRQLRGVLREWVVNPALPPRFQEQVWHRVGRANSQNRATRWARLVNWFETELRRPALAIAYVTVLLALGLTAGFWQVRKESAHLDETLGLRYVRSIDPYQAARH